LSYAHALMSRPRIVHVYKDMYPPVEGGIERTIYHLTRLTADEFEPSVIVASRSRTGSRRLVDGRIEVTEVASFGRALSTPLAPAFIGALRRSRADLFHFHFPHPTGEAAYLLSDLKTPAVLTYHSDVVRQRITLAFYRPMMNRFLARMAVIMPTSQRYLETSETLASFRDRCRVVPLGFPLEDYEPTEETQRLSERYTFKFGEFVFFIGCLRYYKGLHFLIEAARELPKTHIVIAGEGNERARLESLAQSAGLADRVHFLGRVNHAEAVALLHAAAVFCLPAHQRSEAFGLCQVEAMACGLPVVSTNLPTGVPEVNRDGESGLIAPPADARALAAAIRRLLEDHNLRRRLGEGGRERAIQLFTAELMAKNVMDVYRSALEAAR
jgi:glycosyltransferase involved in cell wall biosynthesis